MSAKVYRIAKAQESERWEPVLDSKGQPIPGYRRYRPTGVIYRRQTFRALGIPDFFQSTGEKTIGKAKTKSEILIQRWKNKHLGIDDSKVLGRQRGDSGKTVRAAAQWVLDNVTPERRAKTQRNHRYAIPLIIEEFGSRQADSVTVEDFNRWIMRLRQKKFGTDKKPGERGYRAPRLRKSFECFSKHMNLIYREAYNRKLVSHLIVFPNPDKKLIATRKERARRYSDPELVALWDVLSEDMRDQFVLAAECYMRLAEALRLSWGRIDLVTGAVTLRAEDVKTGSKTGRGRQFILSPLALERMRARHTKRNPRSPFIFPSRNDPSRPRDSNKTAWRTAKRNAGILGRATWHHLRHTAISKAVLETQANPAHVSEYAGVSLQTIQRTYLHSNPEETRAAGTAATLPLGDQCESAVNGPKVDSSDSKNKGEK